MRLKNLVLTAVVLVAVGVVEAQAGTITLQSVGGPLQPFQAPSAPGNILANDVIPGLWGYLNGDLVLTGTAGAQYFIQFTLVASESTWTNQLVETQGNTVLTEATHQGQSISYLHTATGGPNDFLKFQFRTLGESQPILVNGDDLDGAGNAYIKNGGTSDPRTFFVSFCAGAAFANQQQYLPCNNPMNAGFNPTTGDVAWLALDDSGAGPNDNHDDWVGYVTATAVPDGGTTVGLLGAALLGLGALRQRFRA